MSHAFARGALLAAALGLSLIDPATADTAPKDQVAAGHAFALAVCAACHVVGKDQTEAPILRPPAPSFESIAQGSALSEAGLHHFLTLHGQMIGRSGHMPNPQLADYQIDEVIAYILSLKAKPQ